MRNENFSKAAIVVKAALLSMAMTGCNSSDDDPIPVDPSGPVEPANPDNPIDPDNPVDPVDPNNPYIKSGLELQTLNGGAENYWRGYANETARDSFVYYRIINHDDEQKDLDIKLSTDFEYQTQYDYKSTQYPVCGDTIGPHEVCDLTYLLSDPVGPDGTQKNIQLVVRDYNTDIEYRTENKMTEVSESVVVNTDNDNVEMLATQTMQDYYEVGKTYEMRYQVEVQGQSDNASVHVTTDVEGEIVETYNH